MNTEPTEITIPNSDLWRSYEMPLELVGFWKIGPMKLWIKRLEREVHLVHKHSSNYEDTSVIIETPYNYGLPDTGEYLRFATQNNSPLIRFTPTLPDRSVVVKPEKPLYIVANDSVEFFIASSVWIDITRGSPTDRLWLLPVFKLQDTWFGENPTDGELCYVAKTRARLNLSEMPLNRYRFVCNIKIVNETSENLAFDRVKITTEFLNLYRAKSGRLISDNIIVTKLDKKAEYQLQIEKPSTAIYGEYELISRAKKDFKKGVFKRKISKLIG